MAIKTFKEKFEGKTYPTGKLYTGKDAQRFKKYYKGYGDVKVLKIYEDQTNGQTMALIQNKKRGYVQEQYAVVYSSGDYSLYHNLKDAEKQFKHMEGDLV